MVEVPEAGTGVVIAVSVAVTAVAEVKVVVVQVVPSVRGIRVAVTVVAGTHGVTRTCSSGIGG